MTDKTAAEMLREALAGMTERPWGQFAATLEGSGEEQTFIQPISAKEEFSDIVCRDLSRGDLRGIVRLANCADELIALVEAVEQRLNKFVVVADRPVMDAHAALTAKLQRKSDWDELAQRGGS